MGHALGQIKERKKKKRQTENGHGTLCNFAHDRQDCITYPDFWSLRIRLKKKQGKCNLWTVWFVWSGLKRNVKVIFLKIKAVRWVLSTVSTALALTFLGFLSSGRWESKREEGTVSTWAHERGPGKSYSIGCKDWSATSQVWLSDGGKRRAR